MANPLIAAVVSLVSEALKLVNTQQSRKYIDKVVDIKMAIQKEEALGYDADDAKIEALYKELSIVVEAAENEIRVLQKKAGTT